MHPLPVLCKYLRFVSLTQLNIRDLPEAISHPPLTAEDRVQSEASQYGICGGQNDTGTQVSFRLPRFYPFSTIPPMLHTHLFIHHRRCIKSATNSVVKQHAAYYSGQCPIFEVYSVRTAFQEFALVSFCSYHYNDKIPTVPGSILTCYYSVLKYFKKSAKK